MSLLKARDDYKKKLAAMEEENQAFKGLGGGGLVRKTVRSARVLSDLQESI
jgi:hypothetical protein